MRITKKSILKIFLGASLTAGFFACIPARSASASQTLLTLNLWKGIDYSFVVPSISTAQDLLIKEGYLDIPAATGYFGDMTADAVARYQTAHGISSTGIIGSLTRRMINNEVNAGRTFNPNPLYKEEGSFTPADSAVGETEKVLDVPLIEQVYPLSCEAASLQMALAYKGATTTQDALIDMIGTSAPLYKYVNSDSAIVWGDPDEGFVGNIKGWLYTTRNGDADAIGWAVNEGPVAKAADEIRPKSSGTSGGTLRNLIDEINAGNPIVVWEYSKLPSNLETLKSYVTPAGKTVPFISEHARTVVGYKKEADGSYIMLINDPEYGRLEVPQDDFMSTWTGYFNQMVVVR